MSNTGIYKATIHPHSKSKISKISRRHKTSKVPVVFMDVHLPEILSSSIVYSKCLHAQPTLPVIHNPNPTPPNM